MLAFQPVNKWKQITGRMHLDLRNETLQEKSITGDFHWVSKDHVAQGTPGDKADVLQSTEVSQPPCE